MIKKCSLLIILLFNLASIVIAQGEWVISEGGGSATVALDIQADDAGNAYLLGSGNNISIQGTQIGTYSEREDVLIKLNPFGDVQWITKFQAHSEHLSADRLALSVSPDGFSHIAGTYQDQALINGEIWEEINFENLFAAKIDQAGNFMWTKQLPISYRVRPVISTDGQGDVYLAAGTNSSIYYAKLSGLNGEVLWSFEVTTSISSSGGMIITDLECDDMGNCYSTGHTRGWVSFIDTTYSTSNTKDIFILKLDKDGNKKWLNIEGDDTDITGSAQYDYYESGLGIAVSSSNKVYVFGSRTTDQIGSLELTQGNGFIAKLDANSGAYDWVHGIGDFDLGNFAVGDMCIDDEENIYIANEWENNSKFYYKDFSLPILEEPTSGSDGSAIIALDKEGELINIRPITQTGSMNAISTSNNRIFLAGFGNGNIFLEDQNVDGHNFFAYSYGIKDYQITVDSAYVDGPCFASPFNVELSTSSFHHHNTFYINWHENLDNLLSLNYFPLEIENETEIESMTFQLNSIYNHWENSGFRVCSTAPAVCSELIFAGIPEVKNYESSICKGDTIKLTVDSWMQDINWMSDAYIEEITMDSIHFIPESSDAISVSALHPLGCELQWNENVNVTQVNEMFTYDTVSIECNNPYDGVDVKYDENGGPGYSYSFNISSDQSLIPDQPGYIRLTPQIDTLYKFTSKFNGCSREDSLFVYFDECNLLEGIIDHFSGVSINFNDSELRMMRLNPTTSNFETIKSHTFENWEKNFRFRTSDDEVYLFAEPKDNEVYTNFFPTYHDTSNISIFASPIQLIDDTTKTDMYVYGYGEPIDFSEAFWMEGRLLNFYNNAPMANVRLILAESAAQPGSNENPDLILRHAITDDSGLFEFPRIKEGDYHIWMDDLNFDLSSAPLFQLTESVAEDITLYARDNELLSCASESPPINCTAIHGNIFFDEYGDCEFDDQDEPFVEHVLEITPGPIYINTDEEGAFRLSLVNGEYTIKASDWNQQYTEEVCSNGQGYMVELLDTMIELNFGFQFTPDIYDLEIHTNIVNNRIRPGRPFNFKMDYKNRGTEKLDPIIRLKHPTYIDYASSSVSAFSILDDMIEWDLNSLDPLESGSITVEFDVAPDFNLIGDTLKLISEIYTDENDETPSDNIDTTCMEIFGPFDPNDKAVEPMGWGLLGEVTREEAEILKYRIRFQNVGNDTAFKVVVIDTLDQLLNPLSLRILATSHPYDFNMYGNGILDFTFDDINLVDSTTNELESHGFIEYSISPKPELEINDVIYNKAGIYFDFNPPIITNQVITTIVEPNHTDDILKGDQTDLLVFPNPTASQVRIDLNNAYSNTDFAISIYDTHGNLVLEREWAYLPRTLHLDNFAYGIYFIAVYNKKTDETFWQKVVKMP